MIITDQQKYIGNTAIGLAGGVAAYRYIPSAVTGQYINYYKKHGVRFSQQEQHEIWQAAEKELAASPIKDKVQLIDYNPKNWESIADNIVQKRRDYLRNNKSIIAKLRSITWPSDEVLKDKMYVFAQGRNACYMPSTSQILVNKDLRANAVFHEIGHALNAKEAEGLGRVLAKTRVKGSKAAPLVFGISLLTPKVDSENTKRNPMLKALYALKKYSGLIVAGCLLPLVAEEGLASVKGARMAKSVLSPEVYKKMITSNKWAFSAYAISAAMTGFTVFMANHIKDKVTGSFPKSA